MEIEKAPSLPELSVFSCFGSLPPLACQRVMAAPSTGLPISETLPLRLEE
ncbi:MAG: hypothetical protein ACJ0G7_03170 [Parasynechococcus sp.]